MRQFRYASAVDNDSAAATTALVELATHLGVSLPRPRAESVVAFGGLLLQWAKVINLTGASSLEVLVRRHFSDSLAAAKVLPPNIKFVDVGSGGGLPGIPLLLMRPDLQATLVEPTAKRVAFLRTAVRAAGLQGRVDVIAGRVGPGEAIEAGTWSAALARAVWNPEEWVSMGTRLVKPGGIILAYCVSSTEAERLAPLEAFAYAADRWLAVVSRSLDPSL